jgi:hypothetical protein
LTDEWTEDQLRAVAQAHFGLDVPTDLLFPLTPFQYRAASFLLLAVESPPPQFSLDVPEFHLELLGRKFEDPPVDKFTECPLDCDYMSAALFVEVFASNQSAAEGRLWVKDFLQAPKIYRFALPVELPVLIAWVDQKAQLRFADTLQRAEFVRRQVELGLTAVWRSARFRVALGQIAPMRPSEKEARWLQAEFLGMSELPLTVRVAPHDIIGFQVDAVGCAMSPRDRELGILKQRTQELFMRRRIYRCPVCNELTSIGAEGPCRSAIEGPDVGDDEEAEESVAVNDTHTSPDDSTAVASTIQWV